ncbi:flagellar assembly peptidoglycan hydrolase FlgJ [Pelomonas sp. KK5]|uniref:flagellar assembly peptidoglycan hydrolase FlgJ n=1 Tax=Pelomonas sp. KK5 TaxID=1855730 RepID=UPI00097C5F5E|nr:flagellar assembly peptidoglycan hydrolase FlgJ [Pelomonas sp. KK5]
MSSTPASFNSSNSFAADTRSIDSLKAAAARDPKSAIKDASRQFESLFMQEVMKSMRASTLASGMMENSATQMGTEMLDSQYATKLSGLPGGLSDAISRQLQRQMGVKADGKADTKTDAAAATNGSGTAATQAVPALAKKGIAAHVQSFIQQHDGDAKTAEAATGIPASFMLAQAAHESGWGRHEITGKGGVKSHNLFGIKATPGWTGKVAEVQTTEYVNGQAQKVTAKFRAYDSYAEAFKDYAKLISGNERYQGAVAQAQTQGAAGFARGLQKAGYATDPQYATKLAQVINTTVRVQRALT